MRPLLIALTVAVGFAACACGDSVDYSKAQAQTGGAEQGVYHDQQGSELTLTSGKYTYKKDGGPETQGTYTVAKGQIQFTANTGATLTGTWTDKFAPIVIDGETLTKTD